MVSDAAVEAVAGAVGSIIAVGLTYPLTTVSTWQALDHKEEKDGDVTLTSLHEQLQRRYRMLPSPFKELGLYSQTKGWAALYAGLKPCLAATGISMGVYFYLYSTIRQAAVARKLGHKGQQQLLRSGASADTGRTVDIGVIGSTLVASLAGCGNVLVTAPVWVIATQMLALQKHQEPKFRSMTASQVAQQLYNEGGIKGFWKGLVPSLVLVANPTLQYIVYEWLTSRLLELRRAAVATLGSSSPLKRPPSVRLSASDVFLLTALAKMGSTLIMYPMLLIKSRLQAMNKQTDRDAQYAGVMDAVARILRAEGFRGFFKGIQVKMVQTVLSAALLMSIKEQLYGATKAVLLAN